MKPLRIGLLLLVATATLSSAANDAQSTRKMDMAETMGLIFSTTGGIKHNPVDLLWKISTFRAGISNAISTEIPTAPVATSKRVFLERGSVNAGLKHIWIKHGLQFAQLCKVYNENQLQQYLYNVMSRGRKFIRAYKPIQGGGLKIVYQLPGLFLHVIMGDNGFIVTAYPTTKPEDYYNTRGYIPALGNDLTPKLWKLIYGPLKPQLKINPSTYTLRYTTSLYNLKPNFRYRYTPKRNFNNKKKPVQKSTKLLWLTY